LFGEVSLVMADHPNCGLDNLAFKISGTANSWICTSSVSAVSVVLTAITAKKPFEVAIDDNAGTITCTTISQYSPALYLVMYP
jgi:hypothetical protein